jgi:Cu/Ag efflux protein CusF
MKPLKTLFFTLISFASVLFANAADTSTSKAASAATDAEISKAAKIANIDFAKLKLIAKKSVDEESVKKWSSLLCL